MIDCKEKISQKRLQDLFSVSTQESLIPLTSVELGNEARPHERSYKEAELEELETLATFVIARDIQFSTYPNHEGQNRVYKRVGGVSWIFNRFRSKASARDEGDPKRREAMQWVMTTKSSVVTSFWGHQKLWDMAKQRVPYLNGLTTQCWLRTRVSKPHKPWWKTFRRGIERAWKLTLTWVSVQLYKSFDLRRAVEHKMFTCELGRIASLQVWLQKKGPRGPVWYQKAVDAGSSGPNILLLRIDPARCRTIRPRRQEFIQRQAGEGLLELGKRLTERPFLDICSVELSESCQHRRELDSALLKVFTIWQNRHQYEQQRCKSTQSVLTVTILGLRVLNTGLDFKGGYDLWSCR